MSNKTIDRATDAYKHPTISLGGEDAKLLFMDPNGKGFIFPLAAVWSWNPSVAIQVLRSGMLAKSPKGRQPHKPLLHKRKRPRELASRQLETKSQRRPAT